MARINVEDSIWSDDRFLRLIEITGNRALAVGYMVLAWKAAQKFWMDGRKPIPTPVFKVLPGSDELVESGLAEPIFDGDFYHIKGSEEHFAWLMQKKEAGKVGGKQSGIARRIAHDEIIEEKMKRREAAVKRLEPSYSYSYSNTKNTTTTARGENLPEQIQEAHEVWSQTLASFGVPKTPMAAVQENSLARAIMQLGFENVILALEGQRYEAPNKTFDPRRHLSIDRALHRDRNGKSRWEEFKNMALANRAVVENHNSERSSAEATA